MAILTDLPNELLEAIVRHLPLASDRVRFGKVCRHFWEVSKPEIYRSVTVRTQRPSTAFAAHLASLRHSDLIRELRVVIDQFKFPSFPEEHPYLEEYVKDDAFWQGSVGPLCCLLEGIPHNLSRLKALKLEFPGHYHVNLEEVGSRYQTGSDEIAVWQLIMARTEMLFTAVAANQNSSIKDLRISNLPAQSPSFIPKATNVFTTIQWHTFLNQIEHFELSLHCDEDHPDYEYGAHDTFHEFVENLQAWIFSSLSSAKYIKIEGPVLYGLIGHDYANRHGNPLPLGLDTMPALTVLELVSIAIDHSLINFLEHRPAHSPPLNLILKESTCHYYQSGVGVFGSCLLWHQIFEKMEELVGTGTIQSLAISFLNVTDPRFLFTYYEEHDMSDIKTLIADNPGRIMFPYFKVGWIGLVEPALVATKQAFLDKEDQQKYERLISRLGQRGQSVNLIGGGPGCV